MRQDMSNWYDEDFDIDTIEEFFAQSQEFTKQAIEKSGIKGFRHANFNFFEPLTQHSFTPRGIVVSSSRSISVWDTLLSIASHAYNTHFIISNRKPRKGDGSLLEQLPATVLIPSTLTNVIHHAGYLSKLTWGIEIRNVGKLRPVIGDDRPDPVYRGEESNRFFMSPRHPSKYYWWNNLWREEFTAKATPYGKYFYEHPMNRQIETLLILIKILSKYSPIRRELVVPLDCVIGGEPQLPTIDWTSVRLATLGNEWSQEPAKNRLLNNTEIERSDYASKEQRDEYFLRELNSLHAARVGFDNGNLDFIFEDKKLVKTAIKEFGGYMQELGYDTTNAEVACRMLTIARGGRLDIDQVYTKIAKKFVEERKGVELPNL